MTHTTTKRGIILEPGYVCAAAAAKGSGIKHIASELTFSRYNEYGHGQNTPIAGGPCQHCGQPLVPGGGQWKLFLIEESP